MLQGEVCGWRPRSMFSLSDNVCYAKYREIYSYL